jgi:hypothetical protein
MEMEGKILQEKVEKLAKNQFSDPFCFGTLIYLAGLCLAEASRRPSAGKWILTYFTSLLSARNPNG